MNISFSKLLSHIKHVRSPHLSHELYYPDRDWKIILVSFVCVALALAGLSAYLFLKINSGEIFTTSQERFQEMQILDTQTLKETVSRFEAQKARLMELQTSPVVAPDPSL